MRSPPGRHDPAGEVGVVGLAVHGLDRLVKSLLVNNTGINPTYCPIVDLDLDAARRVVEVNCVASLS
jgi:NAD(P)-dependent dehydrogenase (short-subunit alcohol dehydrogenase family)